MCRTIQNKYFFLFSSNNFLGPVDLKELSPSPQKWSPNISKATSVFRFCKSGPETDSKKPTDDVTSVASTSVQRKRKDPRSNPEHTDSKKISRSSRLDFHSCIEIALQLNCILSSNQFSSFHSFCVSDVTSIVQEGYFWILVSRVD